MLRINYNLGSQICAVFFGLAFLILPTFAHAAPYWQTVGYQNSSGCGTGGSPKSTYDGMPSPHTCYVLSEISSGACYPTYGGCDGTGANGCLYYGSGTVGAIDVRSGTKNASAAYVNQDGATGNTGLMSIAVGQTVTINYACQDNQVGPVARATSENDCTGAPGFNTGTIANQAIVTGPSGVMYSGPALVGSLSTAVTSGASGDKVSFSLTCKNTATGKSRTAPLPVLISETTLSISAAEQTVIKGAGTSILWSAEYVLGSSCVLKKDAGVIWQDTAHPSYSFISTGKDQKFTVPSLVTKLFVKLWGAAGSDGYDYQYPGPAGTGGGAGGFTKGVLSVSPGNTYTVVVGNNTNGYGGGGWGGTPEWVAVAPGGGRSAICNGTTCTVTTEMMTAGGGGGSAQYKGGAGGGSAGGNGTAGNQTGWGGTQTAGGVGQDPIGYPQYDGSRFKGGFPQYGGGGGGGGWFGGGAGGFYHPFKGRWYIYGGGGGSGHCGVGNCVTTQGRGDGKTANSDDPDLPAGLGSRPNGNGFVKIYPVWSFPTNTIATGPLTKTTTFTLSCLSVEGVPFSANTTVQVNDPCPINIKTAPGNNSGYWLESDATRRLSNTTFGFNACLQNTSDNDYYIPAKTQAELQSFFTTPPPGVSVL